MTTPADERRTTADQTRMKVLRVKGALLTPELCCKSNRELARELQVDEKTVRNWRAWANQYVPQPEPARPAKKPKRDAGKKSRGP